MWVPLPHQLRFRRARRELQRIVDELAARRDGRPPGDDALSRLVESASREPDPRVGRQRMRDELVTLLLVGHETTASTLGWTFYLADRHPEVWERLHDEAIEVLGDRLPVYEDLHRLRYTAMVIDEVIRLYPPVWMLSRHAQSADVVGEYDVPAGSDVLVCPYTLHSHPAFWDAPERFDPERFDPARTVDRPRCAYIPFGAGPRFCVGNNLGLMEAVFVVAMVARELRLTRWPGYPVVPEPMLPADPRRPVDDGERPVVHRPGAPAITVVAAPTHRSISRSGSDDRLVAHIDGPDGLHWAGLGGLHDVVVWVEQLGHGTCALVGELEPALRDRDAVGRGHAGVRVDGDPPSGYGHGYLLLKIRRQSAHSG
jgi:Cytochrome P450